MTTTVDVDEAQQQLSYLLDLATAGNEVIISVGEKTRRSFDSNHQPDHHSSACWRSS